MQLPSAGPEINWSAVRVSLEKSAVDLVEHSIALKRAGRNSSAASTRASAVLLAELAKALGEGGA